MIEAMIRVKKREIQTTGASAKSDYRRRNPEKALAHRLIAKALAAGVLARPYHCEGCALSAKDISSREGKDVEDRRAQRLAAVKGWDGTEEKGLSTGLAINARPMRGLVLSAEQRHLIQYHHEDYARPFWVTALCPPCHKLVHKDGPDALEQELPVSKMDARERACRHFALQEGVQLKGPVSLPCRKDADFSY